MAKRRKQKKAWGTVPSDAARAERYKSGRSKARLKKASKRRRGVQGPIELRIVSRWRNKRTGKLVSFVKRKGATREFVQQQIDVHGRVLRAIGHTTKEEVMRTVVPGLIEESGPDAGLIHLALQKTNILSQPSLRGARKILVKVSGVNPHGELDAFKFDMDKQFVDQRRRKLAGALVGMILSEMRGRSWRTWYSPNQVDWSKVKYTTKSAVMKRVPMRNVEIVVRVLK